MQLYFKIQKDQWMVYIILGENA